MKDLREDLAFKNAKMEYEVDTLTEEFRKLQEQNTELDWDIPSQYQQLLDNVGRLGQIENRLEELQRKVISKPKRHLKLVWSRE